MRVLKFDDSVQVMQVLRDTGTALNLSGERFSAFREQPST